MMGLVKLSIKGLGIVTLISLASPVASQGFGDLFKQLETMKQQMEGIAKKEPKAPVAKPVSPSFDCAKATQSADKTICADADLAALDVKYSGLYSEARNGSNRDEALQYARQLTAQKFKCTTDARCIADVYRDGIGHFETVKKEDKERALAASSERDRQRALQKAEQLSQLNQEKEDRAAAERIRREDAAAAERIRREDAEREQKLNDEAFESFRVNSRYLEDTTAKLLNFTTFGDELGTTDSFWHAQDGDKKVYLLRKKRAEIYYNTFKEDPIDVSTINPDHFQLKKVGDLQSVEIDGKHFALCPCAMGSLQPLWIAFFTNKRAPN